MTLTSRRKRGFTLIELMIVIAIIAILAAILVPSFLKARAAGQLSGCQSGLKTVAQSVSMYATDYDGRYPTSLATATGGKYMNAVPICPSAGTDTYTAGYSAAQAPDTYTVVCAGTNHGASNIGANYPQYTCLQGLIKQ
jgi:prepilin-type N-terminal cleavage/methylation domain-containing protein